MRLSSLVETSLLDWAFGTDFPPPPREGLWLSLHNSTVIDQSSQTTGWAGGDRIPLHRTDFASGDDGGLVNTRALMLGVNNHLQHIEGFAVWLGPTSWEQFGTGVFSEPMTLKPGNPAVFFAGDLILKLR